MAINGALIETKGYTITVHFTAVPQSHVTSLFLLLFLIFFLLSFILGSSTMAALSQNFLFFSLLLLSFTLISLPGSESFSDNPSIVLLGDGLNLPITYGGAFGFEGEDGLYGDGADTETEEEDVGGNRRSLFWQRKRYYISYGALSANRVPCPPRSGRSYYTHNCYRARGPVHPYSRGCSMITRCRR